MSLTEVIRIYFQLSKLFVSTFEKVVLLWERHVHCRPLQTEGGGRSLFILVVTEAAAQDHALQQNKTDCWLFVL